MCRMFVTGDTHGPDRIGFRSVDGVFTRLNTNSFPEQKELCKKDIVFILGDFGCIWEQEEAGWEKNVLSWLEDKSFTTCFIDGNHENHRRLREYPVREWHGGKIHEIRPSVFHLMRGQLFLIDGIRIFTFGGARSHDIQDGILDPVKERDKILDWTRKGKLFRINRVTWWEEEMPTEEEMKEGRHTLEEAGWKADFIMTHTCAASTKKALLGDAEEADELNDFLEEIKQKCEYRKWFFAHYHDNREMNEKEILLYEQIIRIH